MSIIKIILISALVYTLGFIIIGNIGMFIIDKVRMNKYDPRDKNATPPASIRHSMQTKMQEGLHDTRILPLYKMVEKKDKKGNPVKDKKGKPEKEKVYVLEKHDKYGIPVEPSKTTPTWKMLYAASFLLAPILTGVFYLINPVLMVIPFIMVIATYSIIASNGKKLMNNEEKAYTDILAIAKQRLNVTSDNPREVISIRVWEYEGEQQTLADGKTRAGENGETELISKDVKYYNDNGRPRIARFRDTPSDIVIDFPINFMKAGIDGFLKHMNQNIGGGSIEWVAEKRERNKDGSWEVSNGWDFTNRKVYLHAMPPLPSSAKLPKDIDKGPWNAIRLGVTTSGEAIWDLSGQGAQGSKIPLKGNGLGVTTPMALVPLALDTQVLVMVDDDEDQQEHADETVGE